MTREIRKHALAENDLIEIWEYTYREWDAAQPISTWTNSMTASSRLADNPEMGATRDYVREGYRFINSHAVYYTVAPSAIHIIRVLHGQMDPGRYL